MLELKLIPFSKRDPWYFLVIYSSPYVYAVVESGQ